MNKEETLHLKSKTFYDTYEKPLLDNKVSSHWDTFDAQERKKFEDKYEQRGPDFYDNYKEPTIDSCLALWKFCLKFTFHEALYTIKEDPIHRERAIRWFIYSNPDFAEVCEMCGYNPQVIREVFIKEYRRRGGKV